MEYSRTQNSARNIKHGIINGITAVVFPFIVRTFFIKYLGEEHLGLNSLYKSILQVLNMTELGLSSAIVAGLYKPLADNDEKKVSAYLNLYKKFYFYIGFIILIAGLLITPFLEIFISGNIPSGINIYILWIFYLAEAVISYFFFSYKVSLINASQRSDITKKIGTTTKIIISIFQLYFIFVYKSFYSYVILNMLNTMLYNICCSIACDKMYPQYTCKGELDTKTKKDVKRNIKAVALQKIGNTISTSLDSIVISSFLGLKIVAIYGNYYYIVTAICIFLNLIYTAITASVGNSIVTRDKEKNFKDFNKFSFFNIWIIGWCSICFMCLFQDFMEIWMGKTMLFDVATILFLVIRFYFEYTRKIVLLYKDASGLWLMDKYRPIVGAIFNLVLNIILVKYIGVVGVMISTILSYTLIEIPWETKTLFKGYFNRNEKTYYLNIVIETAKLVIIGAITYFICINININNYANLFIKSIICIILPNIMFILINKKDKNFKEYKNFMKNVLFTIKDVK